MNAYKQMVSILREADKRSVAEIAKKHKSEHTIFGCRRQLGTLKPADAKRLRELQAENAKLKHNMPERGIDIDILDEISRRKRQVWVGARHEQDRNHLVGQSFCTSPLLSTP